MSNGVQKKMVSVDRQLVGALAALLVLYTIVTLRTLMSIPTLHRHRVFFDEHTEAAIQSSQPVPKAPDDIEELRHQFPVHVRDDVEVIEHPGLAFANEPSVNEHMPPKLTVPRFWDPPAYHNVRKFLGNYGETLMTPEQASQIGSYWEGMETIYVSVASYRDPECSPTVDSIYARAKHPDRIRVAVVLQRTEDDEMCPTPEESCSVNPEQALCKYRHLIDIYEMDARLAVGPVFARHLGHRLYRGEYYAMQVDSHVRFIQDWDDDIITQFKQGRNEMAVLTTYLSDLIGSIDPVTHESRHPDRPIMCNTDYEGSGQLKHLRHGQQPEGPAGIHGQPTLHPFWAAGFSFARGHFVVNVPYDQYLPMVFQGEEISIGLRGFTYGYDYYANEKSICFHMYAVKENKKKRNKVSTFWENAPMYRGAGKAAMQRLNGIIGLIPPDVKYFDREERRYGLGKIRTTEKFYKTFGIHTDTQTVEHHLCRFVGKPMMRQMLPHLRPNGMGIDYSNIDFEFVDPIPKKK
jgi:[Skp1-protein]-hydroxyproline N-acetylglucosaminyltransferase